ncbi:hypothetical protein COCNU_scaffold020575G000010 [Cocos nucifera]|nr:hypothetical protein [Cocos nucifera]
MTKLITVAPKSFPMPVAWLMEGHEKAKAEILFQTKLKMDYMEYVIVRYIDDPSTQPLVDLEGWLRVIEEVSTSKSWNDAYVEEVMQRLLS